MLDGLFEERVLSLLSAHGFSGVEVLGSLTRPDAFGYAETTVKVGPVCLRFRRDRGQEFLEVRAPQSEDRYFQFCDLEVAMGWEAAAPVTRAAPEALGDIIGRLGPRLAELASAFSPQNAAGMLARLEMASRTRGKAFLAHLQRLSAEAKKKR